MESHLKIDNALVADQNDELKVERTIFTERLHCEHNPNEIAIFRDLTVLVYHPLKSSLPWQDQRYSLSFIL